jgi:hypothetical protein
MQLVAGGYCCVLERGEGDRLYEYMRIPFMAQQFIIDELEDGVVTGWCFFERHDRVYNHIRVSFFSLFGCLLQPPNRKYGPPASTAASSIDENSSTGQLSVGEAVLRPSTAERKRIL